jgi:hypothetical protein
MGKALPQQHPAVVLRSRYDRLRTLLVIALIAVAGLAVTVGIVASEGDSSGITAGAEPQHGDFRADGRPQATAVPESAIAPRYDGGPNEGSADVAPLAGRAPGAPQTDDPHYKWPVRGELPRN